LEVSILTERNITEEATNRLIEQLKAHLSESFYVTYYDRYEETERLATALSTTLRKAGWTQDSPFVHLDSPLNKNLVEVEADDGERPGVKTLVEWLDAEGFQTKFNFNPSVQGVAIHVEPQG
jgi:hypothetical protein